MNLPSLTTNWEECIGPVLFNHSLGKALHLRLMDFYSTRCFLVFLRDNVFLEATVVICMNYFYV